MACASSETTLQNSLITNQTQREMKDLLDDPDEFLKYLNKPGGKNYTPPVSFSTPKPIPVAVTPNSKVQSLLKERNDKRAAYQADNTTDENLLKNLKNEIGQKSEEIAEAMADIHYTNLGYTRVHFDGLPKQGSLDRVYQKPDGSFLIVECKGGESPLKGRKGADLGTYPQQGTKKYNETIVDIMNSKKELLPSDQRQDLDKLKEALKNNEVETHVFSQKFDIDGNLKPATFQKVSN